MNIAISIGTRADYLALAHLHYRSGPPATIARVLVATIDASAGAERETPIGVLVVSMPTLSGSEAVASMGNLCPFFARAGMTPIAIRPSSRDDALRRALRDHGLEPVDLCDAPRVARRACARPALGRALRTWADASRATRAQRHASTERLAVLAARSISHRKVAFVHTFARDAAAPAHS